MDPTCQTCSRRSHFTPDQGWSWVILAAAFLSSAIFDGIVFSFGIFLSDLANYFGASLGKTAWIGSTLCAVYCLVGPIATILCSKFGCRAVTIAGSLISTVGFLLSILSPTVEAMIMTFGIIGGLGFGLMYHCAYVMIGYYFEKKRALATGITSCGSGVGIFIFSQIGDALLKTQGWKCGMWIIAGVALQGVVLGALYRPVPRVVGEEEKDADGTGLKLFLLKSPPFMVFCFSSFLCMIGFLVPYLYLPEFAIVHGASRTQASFLISLIGVANIVGRVATGWISDKPWADPLKIYNCALILGGSITVACTWFDSYNMFVVYAVVFGLAMAAYVCLCAVILVEFLGLELLSSAFGFLNMFRGIAILAGSPLAGKLHDLTGWFSLPFYVSGTSIAAAGLLCLPLRMVAQCQKSIKHTDSDIPTKCILNLQQLKITVIEMDGYSRMKEPSLASEYCEAQEPPSPYPAMLPP